jgi:hypothetical protein
VITFILGWLLIFQQALFVDPSQVNEVFLWIAATLVGVPGGAEAVARIRSGMAGSPTPPASPPSLPSSPSSSGGDQV